MATDKEKLALVDEYARLNAKLIEAVKAQNKEEADGYVLKKKQLAIQLEGLGVYNPLAPLLNNNEQPQE